ncbi:MAG: glucodextranase DOMON-like domain-containing protein [Carboxydocellales bacterium]
MPRHNYLMYLMLLVLLCSLSPTLPVYGAALPTNAVDNTGLLPIFSKEDSIGDEKGPGSYTYPHSPVFNPRKGLFDLTKIEILNDSENYYFLLTMGAMSNPWGAPEGFSHQRIAIYIDSIPNQGRTEAFREGAFVDFDSEHGWEYLVDIKGWNNSRVHFYTDERDSLGEKGLLQVKLLPGTNTIQAKVPIKLLDSHPKTWGVYVLVGAMDGMGPDDFRQVLKTAAPWQFGGGTDTFYDPNILDLLDPDEPEHSQSSMLASYNIAQSKLAVIYPVLLTNVPAGPLWWRSAVARVEAPVKALLTTFPWASYYPVYISAGVAILLIILLLAVNWYRYTHRKST